MIDAVGFEAKGSTTETILSNLKIEGSSGKALRQCIAAVRRGGVVSVPGVYAGFIHGFLFGDAFDKGLSFKMGQTHVHAAGELLPLIEKGCLHRKILSPTIFRWLMRSAPIKSSKTGGGVPQGDPVHGADTPEAAQRK